MAYTIYLKPLGKIISFSDDSMTLLKRLKQIMKLLCIKIPIKCSDIVLSWHENIVHKPKKSNNYSFNPNNRLDDK